MDRVPYKTKVDKEEFQDVQTRAIGAVRPTWKD